MSSVDNPCKETSSCQIESIVPMQQIATLENDRKDKINIPHRTRIKKSIVTQERDAVLLDKLGKCTLNKSIKTVSAKRLQSNVLKESMICACCNEPVIQTDSGKIKPFDIPEVTSHGDNDKITTFYRKPTFSYKTLHREDGDATSGSNKTSNINRWLKSNWSKLTKDRWKMDEMDILQKFTDSSQKDIVPAETEFVCGIVREAQEFPFMMNDIPLPMKDSRRSGRDLYAPPEYDGCNSKFRAKCSPCSQYCCGPDACTCCKLACRIFGCKCKCKRGRPMVCCAPNYPVCTLSLNALERAHLQDLYNTPCSSVQFSLCNCALEDAPVKRHTTAAHYFAHKGLRQVDACGNRVERSRCSTASSSGATEFRSRKSYIAFSVKSAVRQDYTEDDDCCCKCCDLAMVSIDCQTDSRLHLGHLVQTDPMRKKCRPCCKCCRCNRNGGRGTSSCKHMQLNADGTSCCQLKHNVTTATHRQDTSKSGSAQVQRRQSPLCCNKCTGIPYRIRGGNAQFTATDGGCGMEGERGYNSACDKYPGIGDRVRGGANNTGGSCASCNHRLPAGTNNNLFGQVIPGNEECFKIGNQESWLSRKNIARLLGIDKTKKKRFTGLGFRKQDLCDVCKIDLRRQPHIAKKFNQKLDKKQLKRLLALRNMQIEQQILMQQQQQMENVEDVSIPRINSRNCELYHPYNEHPYQYQHLNDVLINQQHSPPLHNRNFEILNHIQSQQSHLLLPPRTRLHRHSRKHAQLVHTHAHPEHTHAHPEHTHAHPEHTHAHQEHTHARHGHKQQRTLIYKTHSTQCETKTQDQSTSCLADFKQAAELGYKLNVLPPFKLDKYRKIYNEASGKFRSPISGREYNLKLEKVDYKIGLLNAELPLLLEIDDKLDKLPKIDRFSMNLSEYKENTDKIMTAICDAILLAKDIGAAGENGYESNNSTATSSNTINSIVDTDFKWVDTKLNGFFNEPVVYRTKTILDYEKIFNNTVENEMPNNNDVVDLFIQSNPRNNIYTNKNAIKNSSLKSVIFRSKNRSKIIASSTSIMFNKIQSNTNMTSAEFSSFILNDGMFQRKSTIRESKKCREDQFKSYQLNEVKSISMKPFENGLEDINGSMPECNVPNFIQENLSIFSNTISDTYSLLKILERNQEKLSNRSFDEEIENVVNYSNFIINDNPD